VALTPSDFWVALGLMLVMEGAAYALFPTRMREALSQILSAPEGIIRALGLAAAILGVGLVWLIRGN